MQIYKMVFRVVKMFCICVWSTHLEFQSFIDHTDPPLRLTSVLILLGFYEFDFFVWRSFSKHFPTLKPLTPLTSTCSRVSKGDVDCMHWVLGGYRVPDSRFTWLSAKVCLGVPL